MHCPLCYRGLDTCSRCLLEKTSGGEQPYPFSLALHPGIEPGTAGLEDQPGILTVELGGTPENRTQPGRVAAVFTLQSCVPRHRRQELNPLLEGWSLGGHHDLAYSGPKVGVEPTTSAIPKQRSST